MVQKAFISDSDRALADLIWNSIKNEPATKNVVSSQEQISFSSPKATGTRGTRKLSIFLYNITEEKASGNTRSTEDCSSKNTMPFVLHYLVTPSTGNDKDDHALLEEIIHAILAVPPIVNSGEENNVEFTTKIDSLSLEELNKLWLALDAPLRLSVGLTVSFAKLHTDTQAQVKVASAAPQAPVVDAKQVTQLYLSVLKTFTEQATGWKKHNMVVKQWVLQNFEKITEMTVDEMLITLNNLGDKLEQHGSTAQFIKPLNQLVGYYQHQLDQLKGMHKVSHGQAENIKTINTWINDVKALLEALHS